MPKVLIVEDDEAMSTALRDGFEYEGFSVIVARDGAIVRETRGRTLTVSPPRAAGAARRAIEASIRERFEATTSVPFEDFPLSGDSPNP